MADAKIISVGPTELTLVADVYARIFSPPQDEAYFERRFRGRINVGVFVAFFGDHPVGLAAGYELRPSTYYSWLCGVVPDARRMGVATQLMKAQEAFAIDNEYHMIRFECQNHHRPMLHLAITEGYELVGIRWDSTVAGNVVTFEKDLT